MPRVRLRDDEIIEAAADVVEDTELSMQTIADRLGVSAPALYKHVGGLDDVRRGLSVLASERLILALRDAAVGRSREDALWAVATAYRGFAEQHTGLYLLTLQRSAQGDELRLATGELVGVFARVMEGFELVGEDAIHAARAVRSALHGFVAFEATNGFVNPTDVDVSFEELVELLVLGLEARSAKQ